jgi:hypothetical protein
MPLTSRWLSRGEPTRDGGDDDCRDDQVRQHQQPLGAGGGVGNDVRHEQSTVSATVLRVKALRGWRVALDRTAARARPTREQMAVSTAKPLAGIGVQLTLRLIPAPLPAAGTIVVAPLARAATTAPVPTSEPVVVTPGAVVVAVMVASADAMAPVTERATSACGHVRLEPPMGHEDQA